MSHNTFGHLFRVTTWGESHGEAIGCVVDGCPPGIPHDGGGDPGVSRQAPAGPIALHHAAARAGHGRDPVRACSRTTTGRQYDGRADLARHPQCRPAVQGLWGHQGQVPPRPCRHHLLAEIRHPRLSRRRPFLGARDGDARRGRRDRAQDPRRRHHPRRAGADRRPQGRPLAVGLGRGRQQSVLLPGPRLVADWTSYLDAGPQVGLVDRRRHRSRGRGRARRPRRADLRQARPGPRRRA